MAETVGLRLEHWLLPRARYCFAQVYRWRSTWRSPWAVQTWACQTQQVAQALVFRAVPVCLIVLRAFRLAAVRVVWVRRLQVWQELG